MTDWTFVSGLFTGISLTSLIFAILVIRKMLKDLDKILSTKEGSEEGSKEAVK